MARLFVAVWPPDDVVAELTALPRKDQRGVRFVDPDRWHITLRFLGDTDPDVVCDALDDLAPAPTTVRLGPAVDVLAERALIVPAHGLDDPARDVAERTNHLGDPPRKRFVGHLTLARLKPRAAMPRVLGARVDESFELSEVALVQSRLHPDGARYETVASWPTG
jgi:RNA 2',3'-cyclic 3'-phosphodiesterase